MKHSKTFPCVSNDTLICELSLLEKMREREREEGYYAKSLWVEIGSLSSLQA
jgi:hypothetical protein